MTIDTPDSLLEKDFKRKSDGNDSVSPNQYDSTSDSSKAKSAKSNTTKKTTNKKKLNSSSTPPTEPLKELPKTPIEPSSYRLRRGFKIPYKIISTALVIGAIGICNKGIIPHFSFGNNKQSQDVYQTYSKVSRDFSDLAIKDLLRNPNSSMDDIIRKLNDVYDPKIISLERTTNYKNILIRRENKNVSFDKNLYDIVFDNSEDRKVMANFNQLLTFSKKEKDVAFDDKYLSYLKTETENANDIPAISMLLDEITYAINNHDSNNSNGKKDPILIYLEGLKTKIETKKNEYDLKTELSQDSSLYLENTKEDSDDKNNALPYAVGGAAALLALVGAYMGRKKLKTIYDDRKVHVEEMKSYVLNASNYFSKTSGDVLNYISNHIHKNNKK